MLKVRFFPGSLCQTASFCPLPLYWSTAIITVPSGSGVDFDKASLRYPLVEGIRCNVITFCPSNNPRSEERRVGKECRSRWSREESVRTQGSEHMMWMIY